MLIQSELFQNQSLAYMHKLKIVHVDVKPENILLRYLGNGKYCPCLAGNLLNITYNNERCVGVQPKLSKFL